MKTFDTAKNREQIENLPEWKKQWVREAAGPQVREYFFTVTKPKWKEFDQQMKDVQDEAARQAGFTDYAEVKRHLEWTRFGTSATAQLEERIKKVEQTTQSELKRLMNEKNFIAARQEEYEYYLSAVKADMLEKYIRYAVKNVKQILANGHMIMECDIDGISDGMMCVIPEESVKALKAGESKYQIAAKLHSGELLALDKHRTLVLENGQVINGYVNNRIGPKHYEHQYMMAVENGKRIVLNGTSDEYDHTLNLFTNTPISFNGENSLKVEYMRPSVELERSRISEIQITTADTPYIRCKIDDVQQMRVQIDESDKALYTNAKTVWGIKAAAEITKMFAEKYYADCLSQEQELEQTIKR